MSVNDIYVIKMFQHCAADSVDIVNTFHYQQTAGPTGPASDQLEASFLANMIPAIRAIQNDFVSTNTIECFSLNNPLDFTTDVITGSSGLATGYGDPLPSFICSAFILTRTSRALRNGHKRFAGLSEGMINLRTIVPPVSVGCATLAALLSQVLPASAYQFQPIIYGEPIPDRPGKPSPRTAPAWCAVGTAAVVGVSTQNSRKK